MSKSNSTKKITIEPLTRVEGHGKVTVVLDASGKVVETRLHIVEFRGFERLCVGRPFWEMSVLVQRLCGICPVSHHLAAAKAMDRIAGADTLTPTAEKLRRLMHYGQILQSHALHFFHLASPDLLFGFDGDPARRNVLGVAARFPDLARQGILLGYGNPQRGDHGLGPALAQRVAQANLAHVASESTCQLSLEHGARCKREKPGRLLTRPSTLMRGVSWVKIFPGAEQKEKYNK